MAWFRQLSSALAFGIGLSSGWVPTAHAANTNDGGACRSLQRCPQEGGQPRAFGLRVPESWRARALEPGTVALSPVDRGDSAPTIQIAVSNNWGGSEGGTVDLETGFLQGLLEAQGEPVRVRRVEKLGHVLPRNYGDYLRPNGTGIELERYDSSRRVFALAAVGDRVAVVAQLEAMMGEFEAPNAFEFLKNIVADVRCGDSKSSLEELPCGQTGHQLAQKHRTNSQVLLMLGPYEQPERHLFEVADRSYPEDEALFRIRILSEVPGVSPFRRARLYRVERSQKSMNGLEGDYLALQTNEGWFIANPPVNPTQLASMGSEEWGRFEAERLQFKRVGRVVEAVASGVEKVTITSYYPERAPPRRTRSRWLMRCGIGPSLHPSCILYRPADGKDVKARVEYL